MNTPNEIIERAKRLYAECVFCLFNVAFEVMLKSDPETEQAYDEAFEEAYIHYEEKVIDEVANEVGVSFDELTLDNIVELNTITNYAVASWRDYVFEGGINEDHFKEDLREAFFELHTPMQYYLIDDWLANRLQAQGEVVVKVHDLNVWVRTCHGEAVYMDYSFQQIAKELLS